MNLLTGNVKKLYFHYLAAAFGSALIVAVYSIVDCAVAGQYEGASGVAAAAAALIWLAVIFLDGPMLRFFGADDTLLPLAQSYLLPVKFAVPLFLFGQFLAAFLRNDNAPGRATAAVLSGGIFNIFGDCFFVFVCDMGIFGAGSFLPGICAKRSDSQRPSDLPSAGSSRR